jgi:uncharacterized protein with PIN domain
MSGTVHIRFYEELNDFLPPERRKFAFQHRFNQAGSVKDMIEALGVPHTEIDLILVNDRTVDFNYQVRDGDHISVYPVFESLDITPVARLRPAPLRTPRFVLDTHLGRLAAYLRLFGFDTLYRNDYDDKTLAGISADERRILLTRDIRVLMRKQIERGYYVRATQPREQFVEVLSRFDLHKNRRPFTRCIHCNGDIKPVPKQEIETHLLPRTKARHDEFWRCAQCNKIYWKGSHYRRMQELVESLGAESSSR